MKKSWIKIPSLLLGGALCLSYVGCNGVAEKGEADVYSVYITDKVLQDIAVEEDVKQPASFSYMAAKGESEAAQIVLTAKKAVSAYTLTAADLTCAETGETFAKENFEVFHQKYIEVKSNSSTAGGEDGPLGWYPDILLPMETAKAYGENKIKKGQNQSIVVQAHVPSTQEVGTYTGTFSLYIDGVKTDVPVSLRVYPTTISEVPTFDSLFLIAREELIYGEGDNSLEMYTTYCDKLIEYKCMPYLLPASTGDYQGYAQQVKKYYHKVSGYSIPWAYSGDYVDKEKLTKYLMEIVKLALEDGVNYLSKVRNYYPLIDEPLSQGKVALANKLSKQYTIDVGMIADEIRALDIPDHATCSKEDIAKSVEQMKNLVTAHIDPQLPEVQHFCAGWTHLDSEAERQTYLESDVDYWWYGCNSPTNPYPTFHTDDMNNLVSTRVMGYMSELYGVQGELFWETVLYRETSFAGGYFHKINTDVYEQAMQYPGTNGDGVLFYPGARYGLDGPLVSNRLLAIRDAHDDFDLVRNVRIAYEQGGKDASAVLAWVGQSMYNGTKVHATSEDLLSARKALFELLSLAQEKQVYITDITPTAQGYDFVVSYPDGENVTYNGKALTNGACQLVLQANTNAVKIACGEYAFSYAVEGKKEVIYTVDGQQAFTAGQALDADVATSPNKTLTVETVEGTEIGLTGKAIKLSFSGEGQECVWNFGSESFATVMHKRIRDLSFTFYNPTDKRLTLAIRANNAQGISFPVTEVLLQPNAVTEVHLGDLTSIKWDLHRRIASLDFAVKGETVDCLYFISASKTEVVK
ncbi:MAG: DUF4091 domain-containing protein [Clostridia bacterium]|nr:DUF4091 domain-containing protein [Clostridia bacterium]